MEGYTFQNPELLEQALTHVSYCNQHGLCPSISYERLEFIGDALLATFCRLYYSEVFYDVREDILTKVSDRKLSNSYLSGIARSKGIHKEIRMGYDLMKKYILPETPPSKNPRVYADTMEALVAAVYLDSGRNFETTFLFTISILRLDESLEKDIEHVKKAKKKKDKNGVQKKKADRYRARLRNVMETKLLSVFGSGLSPQC